MCVYIHIYVCVYMHIDCSVCVYVYVGKHIYIYMSYIIKCSNNVFKANTGSVSA